jgi:hypothetical protein
VARVEHLDIVVVGREGQRGSSVVRREGQK